MIEHIAFDCFGVLINIQGHFFDSVCKFLDKQVSDYIEIFDKNEYDFQRGILSESELWQGVFGIATTQSYWKDAYHELACRSDPAINIFRSLSGKYYTGIFSNIEHALIECIKDVLQLPFENFIKFYSCYESLRKPDLQAYDRY